MLPSIFIMISPLISVISIIYVYNKLQEDRQLIVSKSSGLHNFNIDKPALAIATFLTLNLFLHILIFGPFVL